MRERHGTTTLDRRSFLRRAGVTALVAPAAPFLACGEPTRREERGPGSGHPAGDVTRPVLIPRADGSLHLDAPPHELPAAYVSMERMQLYVDHDFRDQVYWDLRAHISVSTGVWRLPLRGDPPTMAVVPGDVEREFEELSEREWDPTRPPSPGDIRILRGVPLARRIDVQCVPFAGGGAWLRAGPWEVHQAWRGPGDQLVREDFMSVGTGTRFADRECTRPEGPVDVLTWAWTPLPSAG